MHAFSVRRTLFAPALVLLAVLAGPVACGAQTIAGRVIDIRSRLPAQKMAVRVLGDSGTVLATTATDTTGVFYAMLAAPATVRLEFALADIVSFRTDTMTVGADGFVQHDFLVDIPRVFTEMEVEKQVTLRPGNAGPRYPQQLRDTNMDGEVLATFVVDTTGRAIMSTFRVRRATHPAFADAVQAAVARMSFNPAEVRGHKVRQMVQQPFTFSLTR